MDNYDEEVYQCLQENAIFNNIQNEQVFEVFDMINLKRKYTVQERVDPFSKYDEAEFSRRYRLSKIQVRKLYDLLDGVNTLEPMVSN